VSFSGYFYLLVQYYDPETFIGSVPVPFPGISQKQISISRISREFKFSSGLRRKKNPSRTAASCWTEPSARMSGSGRSMGFSLKFRSSSSVAIPYASMMGLPKSRTLKSRRRTGAFPLMTALQIALWFCHVLFREAGFCLFHLRENSTLESEFILPYVFLPLYFSPMQH